MRGDCGAARGNASPAVVVFDPLLARGTTSTVPDAARAQCAAVMTLSFMS